MKNSSHRQDQPLAGTDHLDIAAQAARARAAATDLFFHRIVVLHRIVMLNDQSPDTGEDREVHRGGGARMAPAPPADILGVGVLAVGDQQVGATGEVDQVLRHLPQSGQVTLRLVLVDQHQIEFAVGRIDVAAAAAVEPVGKALAGVRLFTVAQRDAVDEIVPRPQQAGLDPPLRSANSTGQYGDSICPQSSRKKSMSAAATW